jgi:hypothetical protein
MDIEISAEAKNKALNQRVAITVVVLSVFLGLTKIKDDNLVQAMAQAKADALDTWSEYQATKTKLHIAQTAQGQTVLLAHMPGGAEIAAAQEAQLKAEIAKYQTEIPVLATKAKGFEDRYDALNVHDDQFDACDALISIAISAAAVAALADSFWVVAVSWVFGGFGMLMGVAGFANWSLHPDFLSRWLS